jgi:CheY-like chemotaxis protein
MEAIPINKILLAEDEEPVRALLVATLMHNPRYRVLEARDGVEALSLAHRERPHLILLNVRMPLVDGLEVCRQLKDSPDTRDTPVVLLTEVARATDKDRSRQVGADAYISKPFSPVALINMVEGLLGDK